MKNGSNVIISVYDQRTIFTYFVQWNVTTFQIASIIYSLSLAYIRLQNDVDVCEQIENPETGRKD